MTDDSGFRVESAVTTHAGSRRTLEKPTASQWTKAGRDRLYINDLFTSTTDVYVDLDNDTLTVDETMRCAKVRLFHVDRRPSGTGAPTREPSV